MHQNVLILMSGEEPWVGLYRPYTAHPWVTRPIVLPSPHNALISAITNLLKEYHLGIEDMTSIGVSTGPAPYAQLRSHVTTANTLAWVRQIPLFALSPGDIMPDDLPKQIAKGKVGVPVEPVYPTSLG